LRFLLFMRYSPNVNVIKQRDRINKMTPQELRIDLKPVLPTDTEVVKLIEKLNKYQIGLYGIEMCNLESPESLQKNNSVMMGAYVNNELAGIGAVKFFDTYAEIKRMFVEENYRGLSISGTILNALEEQAAQKGIYRICLETGNLHQQALKFYNKSGYQQIESFGNYKPNKVSVYFEKIISAAYLKQ